MRIPEAQNAAALFPGPAVARLAHGERHIPVLDHVLNLPPHFSSSVSAFRSTITKLTGQDEQQEPVHDQNRPKYEQIERPEEAAHEPDGDGPRRRVPELELRQPPHERAELVVLLRRQPARRAVLHALVLLERRIELGRDEGEEDVEQVDAERVRDLAMLDRSRRVKRQGRTNVPPLRDDDAHDEQEEQHARADPALPHVRRRLAEVALVYLATVNSSSGRRRNNIRDRCARSAR